MLPANAHARSTVAPRPVAQNRGRCAPRLTQLRRARGSGDGEEAKALAAGAVELGLRLPPSEVERLLAFLAELRRWNRAYNLVSDAPRLEWVRSHVLDSLSIAPRLAAIAEGGATAPGPGFEGWALGRDAARRRALRVLDLGSGAGLPGIPLGVALPELRFVLLDGTGKKVRFCRHAATALGLRNVEVVEARAERYAPRHSLRRGRGAGGGGPRAGSRARPAVLPRANPRDEGPISRPRDRGARGRPPSRRSAFGCRVSRPSATS